jgi:membrane protein
MSDGRGWRRQARRLRALLGAIATHNTGLAAAGCAFYATLGLFPAASMLISIYGLVLDPRDVEPQLDLLAPLLPGDALSILQRLVRHLVARPRGQLGTALLVGAAVTLWSASAGTKSILAALNQAHEHRESRSFLHFQGVALALTLVAILGAALTLGLLVALPAAAAFAGLPARAEALLHWASLGVMMLFVATTFALLYRYGPDHPGGIRPRILPGTVAATLLWLLAAALFSFYAGNLARFDVTYGPLGAIATVMLWFWVSSYAVLIGAELNAVLEAEG